jgi:hypothetical protein
MPKNQSKKSIYVSVIFAFCLFILSAICTVDQVEALNSQVLGMHIMHTSELAKFRQIYQDEEWRYVTIPITLDDLAKAKEWQDFFDQAYKLKIIPILRLSTRFDQELNAWKIPTRKDIIEMAKFLSDLDWHQDERLIIVFNEVNHAAEWGGKIDPLLYGGILKFTSKWFHSESKNYKILPAALDLAASNSLDTREAFSYLESLYDFDKQIFDNIDYWNSHSYPNPDFAASPKKIGQNSMRGFLYELTWLKNKTGKDFQVFITETGWASSYLTNYYLDDYYLYALNYIWSDSRVKAVTPFIMKGSPGPFASFSFFDASDNPTVQLFALQKALKSFDTLSF